MANQIMQICYYGSKSDADLKAKLTEEIIGGIIPGLVVSLGIQTSLPGLEFYINGSTGPVIVGVSGIYELSLGDLNKISSLRFSESSINAIDNGSHYLIIDILYEDNGGSVS